MSVAEMSVAGMNVAGMNVEDDMSVAGMPNASSPGTGGPGAGGPDTGKLGAGGPDLLRLERISKRFKGEPSPVLRSLDLRVGKGEILVLLGASGCGKTTLLKIVAGLERQDEGSVCIDGAPMDAVAPDRRPISMVFQKALLFRNLTVEKNVNFSPRVNHRLPKSELAAKTEAMLDLVGMSGMGRKKATELSGGQEQRVSLARALMVDPKLLLLDEPLSALDANLRLSMQSSIRELNRKTGVAMLFVTHDQAEALAVADRIAVMHQGGIIQCAAPMEFYRRPASKYVAEFFGWQNFVPASRHGDDVSSAIGSYRLDGLAALRDGCASQSARAKGAGGEKGQLAVRPEAAVNIGSGRLEARVCEVAFRGVALGLRVMCGQTELHLSLPARHLFEPGQIMRFDIDPGALWFVAEDD
jgi:ABC-type Fe3+/spermidine/putrescine transport system ATPase subunit